MKKFMQKFKKIRQERSRLIVLTLLLFAALFSFPVEAKETIGSYIEQPENAIVAVIDGDGLKVGNLRIRLWGIDAPELRQLCTNKEQEYPCGEEAQFLLGALIMGGELRCLVKDTDRYNRIVAQCYAGGHDLGAEMVRQGYALDWKQYSKGFYVAQQQEAQQNKRGLWAGDFEQPWEWRKNKRTSND